MKTERILVVLVGLLVTLQSVSLYKQGNTTPSLLPQRRPQNQAPVMDAPKGTFVDLKGMPVSGSKDAKLVLIEFSDYECPFCARYATGAGVKVKDKYVSAGKVRYAFANNPLPIHPNAKMFAVAAICAGDQGAYWDMHDLLFSSPPKTKDDVVSIAKKAKLDVKKFNSCIEGPAGHEQIQKDAQKARDLKLTGTPSFALGRVDGEGRVTIEKLIVGAQPIAVFEKTIEDMLEKVAKS